MSMSINNETSELYAKWSVAKTHALKCAQAMVSLPTAQNLSDLSIALLIEGRCKAELACLYDRQGQWLTEVP